MKTSSLLNHSKLIFYMLSKIPFKIWFVDRIILTGVLKPFFSWMEALSLSLFFLSFSPVFGFNLSLQPDSGNAFFDCKVLSKQHALLLYEDGAFMLADTASSNGTFINNVRLSRSGEESKPTRIYSGDILRFGSDVVDKVKLLKLFKYIFSSII